MKLNSLINKLKFYTTWYCSMNEKERESKIGRWVIKNIYIYAGILKTAEESLSFIAHTVDPVGY